MRVEKQKFYNSREWIEMRSFIFQRDKAICKNCSSLIIGRYAVHHIIHITMENIHDPSITLNPDNLELLCAECHNKHHKKKIKKLERGINYERDAWFKRK